MKFYLNVASSTAISYNWSGSLECTISSLAAFIIVRFHRSSSEFRSGWCATVVVLTMPFSVKNILTMCVRRSLALFDSYRLIFYCHVSFYCLMVLKIFVGTSARLLIGVSFEYLLCRSMEVRMSRLPIFDFGVIGQWYRWILCVLFLWGTLDWVMSAGYFFGVLTCPSCYVGVRGFLRVVQGIFCLWTFVVICKWLHAWWQGHKHVIFFRILGWL